MICPSCGQDTPAEPIVANLTVCQSCARSLVVASAPTDYGADVSARLAIAEDLRGLSAAQVKELRLARPAAWRNDVRARHAQIVGKG